MTSQRIYLMEELLWLFTSMWIIMHNLHTKKQSLVAQMKNNSITKLLSADSRLCISCISCVVLVFLMNLKIFSEHKVVGNIYQTAFAKLQDWVDWDTVLWSVLTPPVFLNAI